MLPAAVVVALVLACAVLEGARSSSHHYAFYRKIRVAHLNGSRRVFGGLPVSLARFPGTCVLLDRYWKAHCTAAVVAPNWAVTAAHCVGPKLAYVNFNTRRSGSSDGSFATIAYMYAHPWYKVVESDTGQGLDVTHLHHDVGLVRTRGVMRLQWPSKLQPFHAMGTYDLETIKGEKVQVLGFGSTEHSPKGEQLFETQLHLVPCERKNWERCVCGEGDTTSRQGARGVCAGDSGGPVVYRGAQVGVTSMGPIECAAEPVDAVNGATSVFTSLYPYVMMLNDTMHNTDSTLRMRRIAPVAEASYPRAAPLALAAGSGATILLRISQ